MRGALRLRTVAILSLVFTYVFFLDYLPPLRRVHIPFDLEGYHYPLLNYAFESLREGRFPEWDAAQYCGISLVGNTQVALFYPPVWLVFAANAGREALSYQSLQHLVFAHVWLAFVLCYGWLRYKRLGGLPSVLGAGLFAFSGYMMLQLQHLGLVIGYAWMPLGLWGIDQAINERRWQSLWKLILASAMCFLGGYTPTWMVFAVCAITYAGWRWKALLGTAGALALSLAIAMVQILPTIEAMSLKEPEIKYGSGVKAAGFYLSYVAPNYFDFGLNTPLETNPGREYLYLGAPALFGIVCLVRRRRLRESAPLLAMLAVTLVVVTNPYGLVWSIIRHSSLLSQICRDWYFLAGLTLAAAPLTALGLDHFFKQSSRPGRTWLAWLTTALLAGWSIRLLIVGRTVPGVPSGLASITEAAVTLALFAVGAYVSRAQNGARRTLVSAGLLFLVAVEYNVYGTARRFNAAEGPVAHSAAGKSFLGINDWVYARIRKEPLYRVAVDEKPFPYELRLGGLRTPQGFDPFVTKPYKKVVERAGAFRTDREIDIDSGNVQGLRLLGVRYFITSDTAPQYSRLQNNPAFRLLEPPDSYFKVFELRNPQPAFGWAEPGQGRSVQVARWSPERRSFLVSSNTGGTFSLSEQLFPGWRATIDGTEVPVQRWSEAFQAVRVPAGEHRVDFQFRSSGLRAGAGISALALGGLLCGLLRRRATAEKQPETIPALN